MGILRAFTLQAILAPLLILGPGCSETPIDLDPTYSLRVLTGNNQTAAQGDLLPEPLVITVEDAGARGASGVVVIVTITDGDGRIETSERQTGEDGTLALQWRMGRDLRHALRVSFPNQAVPFTSAAATATFKYSQPSTEADGWPTSALPASSGLNEIIRGMDAIRDGDYPEIHSVLLARGDELVFETYFPGHDSRGNLIQWDRDTPHEAQSATKSFRSAMIGIAIDRGFLTGVEQELHTLYPTYSHLFTGTKRDITVEDVLTMSSGLAWDEHTSNSSANTLGAMYGLPYPQWTEYVLSRPMAYSPGSHWVYNTGASIQLNQLVINASGMPLAAFVRQNYSDLVESSTVPGIGNPLGASILPRDMAKLGQVFLNDGLWKTTRVISEEWVEASIQPRFSVNASTSYGYQWWSRPYLTPSGSYDAYYAAGNGGQFIIVIDDLDLVVVFTGGNFGSAQAEQVHPFVEQFIIPAFEGD